MIDASSFSSRHNAFWSNYTPTSEHYVRRINLEYAERWSPPLDKPMVPIRAALVAELAFARVCAKLSDIQADKIENIALADARRRMRPLLQDPLTLDHSITPEEDSQTSHMERILHSFFISKKKRIITRPVFAGCGYIDTSEGDIVIGGCLYEIKTVDRPFRSMDVRQLITYCALNNQSKQFDITNIGIINPRRGLYFEASVDAVSYEISGVSIQNLYDFIVHAISSGDISR
ncbi:hypothetical protein EYW49_18195 [Siculibacillus lacustris]|uniref:Uncharacterized protein n=1 Tax=Siculibacillus lacustris TaxID=1549641 RepID=A0A4Q9VHC3_9HYPH|nr:hypothetical protein [Siculibacillus lacustris]TBW34518.1 hypothetical protein EYW49_18195 [Siculibacillus lacustris]